MRLKIGNGENKIMLNIIVNNGSASKKYSLYKKEEFLMSAHYEKIDDSFLKTEITKKEQNEENILIDVFEKAFKDFVETLIKKELINSEEDVSKIGIRIVAPGTFFQDNYLVDSIFLENLEDKKIISPLHIDPVQKEISEILDNMPKIPIYAISDSSFHKSKPKYSNIYAYPKEITKKLDLYRFGYHGLSVSSVVNKLKEDNNLPSKLIICHLGGGSSVTAVKDGKSIDNSMGYSPIEGIPMATRSGNIDPNSIFAIMDENDFSTSEMQRYLYKECGIKGISNLSGDTRVVLTEAQKGNEDARLALDYYAYEIQKTIGAYKTILGGLDTIVFTGTIGNRSADVRKRICDGLESTGILIDQSKNKLMIKAEGNIKDELSKLDVLVIETREMEEMNRIMMSL